ncbi:MAG: hypothetical protein GY946_12605, partial [bacterium]|nr:hypothetical protein [bacterium]
TVLAGALIGKQWDISGVALGVTVAIVLNFLLMEHLSITTTGLNWRSFWAAQAAGVPLGIGVGLAVGLVSLATTAAGLGPLVVLLTSLAVAGTGVAAVIWKVPERALGSHGLWLLDQFAGIGAVIRRRRVR